MAASPVVVRAISGNVDHKSALSNAPMTNVVLFARMPLPVVMEAPLSRFAVSILKSVSANGNKTIVCQFRFKLY